MTSTNTPVIWELRGQMTLCPKGLPSFPNVEHCAGIYRLRMTSGWEYIGQTNDLYRRLGDYVSGTTGLVQEYRVWRALREATSAEVFVFPTPELTTQGPRCALEKVEVALARQRGTKLLNGAQKNDANCIRWDIDFHKGEIAKLQTRLDSVCGDCNE